jgi:methionyl-tRNA synthetase
MSKSVGNVLSPDDLIATYGLDPIRYFLMREIPHGEDGNFSHEQAVQRINSDLANGIGNLAQRTLSQIYKNCDMKFPKPGTLTDEDKHLLEAAQIKMLEVVRVEFNKFKFNKGLEAIQSVIAKADAYIDALAPWKLKKENIERMNTVLYVLAEAIRCLGIIIQPVVPDSSAKLLDQLKVSADERDFAHLAPKYALKPGTVIDQPVGVFPRLNLEEEAALMWIDSHCHLNHPKIAELGTPEILVKAANQSGVDGMLTISSRIVDEFPDILAIAKKLPNVWCTIGTHPHEAGKTGRTGLLRRTS